MEYNLSEASVDGVDDDRYSSTPLDFMPLVGSQIKAKVSEWFLVKISAGR